MNSQDPTRTHRPSRRRFLQATVASTAALACGRDLRAAPEPAQSRDAEAPGGMTRLSEHLLVYHGPINVGIVRDGQRALLIDCGDEGVTQALLKLGITKVEQVVLTHHHRDQSCGAHDLAAAGAKIGVPAAERPYFDHPAEYWEDSHLWRVSGSFRPDRLLLGQPLRVDEAYADGHQMTFGPAKISVLSTPAVLTPRISATSGAVTGWR